MDETPSEIVRGWTLDTLHTHLSALRAADARQMQEADRRYEARFDAQEKAVAAALTAADKAAAKVEVAAEKRFESVNEFRAQLSDQAATFMPRAEAEARDRALDDKLAALTTRVDRTEAHTGGLAAGWGYLAGGLGLVVVVVNAVFFIIGR